MNRRLLKELVAGLALVCFLSAVAAAGAAAATVSPRNFRYTGQVAGPLRSGILYRLHLDEQVLGRTAFGCRDLRILDNGQEVPYVVIENRGDGRAPASFPLRIIGFDLRGTESSVELEMPEKRAPVTLLDLDIPARDFHKTAFLEGSNDRAAWTLVVQDRIFDFSSQVDLRKVRLSFPASDFRYYRIRLKDAGPAAAKGKDIRLQYQGLDLSVTNLPSTLVRISGVMAKTADPGAPSAVYDEAPLTGYRTEQDRDGSTVLSFETLLPFSRVWLDASNPYYYRRAALYASSSGREKSYTLVQTAPVYRLLLADLSEARTFLEAGSTGSRFYRLVIENGSNPPLAVTGVRLGWVQKNLFFMALSDAPAYGVAFGSETAAAPVYDLGRSITQANWQQVQAEQAVLSGIRENPSFDPELSGDARRKMERALLLAVVGILVVGIGYWLYRLLRHAGRTQA